MLELFKSPIKLDLQLFAGEGDDVSGDGGIVDRKEETTVDSNLDFQDDIQLIGRQSVFLIYLSNCLGCRAVKLVCSMLSST